MPIYDFVNTETNKVEEHWMSHSRLEAFKEANPHLKYRPMAPRLVDPLRLGTYTNRLPDEFTGGILGKAKAAHPLGNIET